jgi:hypothetical protein
MTNAIVFDEPHPKCTRSILGLRPADKWKATKQMRSR